jgi:LysR family cyn operon transcriptional activator
MELRDLVYFLACLDEGHLTRAAAHLHVAQPTLSHALSRLEAEAGEALLDRPRKGRPRILPTAAGRLLEQRARRAISEVRGFSDDLSALRGVLVGQVRIGSMQTLNSTILPVPLAAFAVKHPGVQISLHTLAAEAIPDALTEGRVDIGLLAGAPASALAALAIERLCSEELVLVVRANDPLAKRRQIPLAQLKRQQFVMVLPGTFTHAIIVEACRRAGFTPQTRLALESGEAIREVVRAGLGVTILPSGYIDGRDDSLRAVRLIQPTPRREVLAAFDPRSVGTAAARAFVGSLKQHFAPAPRTARQYATK